MLLGEVLHLFLTGPRFTSYAQVLLLPIFIVIFFQIMTLFDRLNLNRHFGLIPFFIIFFVLQFGDVVHNRTSLIDGTLKETLESYNKPTEDPKLILTWVDIDKYEKVFFENNSLPSTRLWWWHQMKYVDDFYDKNYKMFDDELLETVFTEDVKKERPKIAIIDTSIVSPPDYFLDYIIEHYQFSRLDGDLIYYQLNN